MQGSLFDKYGGFTTLTKLVHEFYRKVLERPQLKAYFEGVSIEKIMEHQVNFLGLALGGPNEYQGRDLKESHAHLNIGTDDFFLVVALLEETLDEFGVEEEDINSILDIVRDTAHEIILDDQVEAS